PGSATFPLPGIAADIVDDAGAPVGIPGGGYLVLSRPWPAMLRGIWGDPQRYRDTYWSRFGDKYFAGDGAKRDEDGYFWLLGRVDDIMLIAGHNISTTEVESALVDHPSVAEAAVVGRNDATTGQAIAAFVTLRSGVAPRDELVEELRNHVAQLIGPIARPQTILFTEELPKTRSVVVDIDGVLSDASRRQHYLESPRQDWRAFFEACGEDPVIEEIHTLLDLLDPGLQIVLLTARPHRVRHLTEAWLRRYAIRWDLLIMRPWGDYELARDFQQSTA